MLAAPWADDPPDENLIEDLHVCDYLPEEVIAEALTEPWTAFEQGSMEEFGNGGWAACEYFQGWIYASRHPISGASASAVVENQLGAGFVTDQTVGRTVFLNDCAVADPCKPAIAISAEPHFVIIVPDYESEATLPTLGRGVDLAPGCR